MMRLCVVLCVVCGCVVGAVADPFSFYGNTVDIEYWAGAGSGAENLAVLVVDFENAAGSYAFGYGWGGTNSVFGKEVLDAVAAGDFSYTFNTDWGSTYVDTMSYAGSTAGEYPYNANNWLYSFVSEDGATWSDPGAGPDTTPITDGGYYGWSAQTSGDWPPANQPNTPVPEPSSLGLLALGAGIATWHRKRKK